jgi:hypothetical protein
VPSAGLEVLAGRDQDWVDVAGIIQRQRGGLDRDLILDELAPLLELKGSASDLDRLRHLLGWSPIAAADPDCHLKPATSSPGDWGPAAPEPAGVPRGDPGPHARFSGECRGSRRDR